MAKKEPKEITKTRGQASGEVTFRCQRCQKQTPLKEMRIMPGFFPLFVVCRDCEKEIQ